MTAVHFLHSVDSLHLSRSAAYSVVDKRFDSKLMYISSNIDVLRRIFIAYSVVYSLCLDRDYNNWIEEYLTANNIILV